MAKCQACGKEIEMKVFWKKYCGRKCRMNGWIISRAKELEKQKGGSNISTVKTCELPHEKKSRKK